MTEDEMRLEVEEFERIGRENKAEAIQEVLGLAKLFLEDAVISSIIRDAGLSRNFTPEEQSAISDFAQKADCPTAFYKMPHHRTGEMIPFENSRSVAMNIAIATGLVRRVIAGEFSGFDDAGIQKLLDENVTYANRPATDCGPDNRKVPWEDFYRIFCEYMEYPGLEDLLYALHDAADNDLTFRETLPAAFDNANRPAIDIAWRYGLTLEMRFAHIASYVFAKGTNWRDEGELRTSLMSAHKSITRCIKGFDHA